VVPLISLVETKFYWCSVVAKPRETLFRHTLRGVLFIGMYVMIDEKTYVKRVVIAGCRDYKNYEQAKKYGKQVKIKIIEKCGRTKILPHF